MGLFKSEAEREAARERKEEAREARREAREHARDEDKVDHGRAAQRSRNTVGDDALSVSERRSNLFSGNHTLLKAGIGMYALHVTSAQRSAARCGKKMQRLKEIRTEYESSQRLAGSPWGLTGLGSNIAGDAFQRKMLELKEEREKRKYDRKMQTVKRSQAVGKTIAGMAMGMNQFSRMLAMKRAIGASAGTTSGLSRDKLAVGMTLANDIPLAPPPDMEPDV